MSTINQIQKAILSLDGGSFQKLFDEYLYRKLKLSNIHPLGSHSGTNKTTKGTPDSFIQHSDGTFTVIMYGSVEADPYDKLKKDILSCFNKDKLELEDDKIKKVICAYASTNITPKQINDLKNLIDGIEIIMIGLGTVSHDLLANYPIVAKDHLNISIDTGQFLTPEDFRDKHDRIGLNAPLDIEFQFREEELNKLEEYIDNTSVTLLTGPSGIGKTKLALEILKRYDKKGYNVICFKNNGQSLFDDVRAYLYEQGEYILFLDDANQITNLEYILGYASTIRDGISINILATVRDYAKKNLINSVSKFLEPSILEIKSFTKNQIKEILRVGLKINNDTYLDRIAKVSNGNPRLAILAGKHAIENGFPAINNALDIFKTYYGDIIHSQELDSEELKVLFILAFLGRIQINNNSFANELLNHFDISNEHFLKICHDLNDMEFVDLYFDEVAQITDQSLSNYLLEYTLIEKRTIDISTILKLGFPQYKEKIIYSINTLVSLFNSEEIIDYIKNEVTQTWDNAENRIQKDYLRSFYSIDEEKALSMLKKNIEDSEEKVFSLIEFDFEKEKNTEIIKTDEINILGGFKYSEYFIDAVDLLILLFAKRPDLIMEFYFVFTKQMSFDSRSYELDYEKEYNLVERMWIYCQDKNDKNFSFLLIQVLSNMMNCQIQQTKQDDDNSIQLITFRVVFTEGFRKLRRLMWSILSELYFSGIYIDFIEKILGTYHGSRLEKEYFSEIFLFDLQCIEELFIEKWDNISFDQANTLKSICKNSKIVGCKVSDSFKRYKENKDFKIYEVLTKERFSDLNYEEQENRKKEIETLIESYTDKDFDYLFNLLSKLETKNIKKYYQLGIVVRLFFNSLNQGDFEDVLKIYFQYNAPYSSTVRHLITWRLLKTVNFNDAKKFIENSNITDKRLWIAQLWETIPEITVTDELIENFMGYFKEEIQLDNPIIPNVFSIKKFIDESPEIIGKMSALILNKPSKPSCDVEYFLGNVYREEDIQTLLNIFDNNIENLKELYLFCVNDIFDYDGRLFIRLLENDYSFWDKYLECLKANKSRDYEANILFEKIWLRDDYILLIERAFDKVLSGDFWYLREDQISTVFPNNLNLEVSIKERQLEWIKKYISHYHDNEHKMRKIFTVITSNFREEKISYYLEFLKHCKDIEKFKRLPLFPMSESWSGSQVPLIDNKITFLDKLLFQIKGVDYIDHRAYLKEEINTKKRYRRSVEREEYLSGDY